MKKVLKSIVALVLITLSVIYGIKNTEVSNFSDVSLFNVMHINIANAEESDSTPCYCTWYAVCTPNGADACGAVAAGSNANYWCSYGDANCK
ncbi:hypothetical protein [Flavivirga spongiicola]|uniref:NVEALA family protein n=1 Tax=Flavivirga spongiicola TaxID=421621 RepID=A0ABU7XVF9_9FLAO|nr:hypothetical protein [Flavivirga sp. MEBiC05379]MDO5979425.1 hypothetical protein [Flavivirga sp. MEBiC05379]